MRLAGFYLAICCSIAALATTSAHAKPMDIYDISLETLQGSSITLSAYKGKTLLVVNTGTHCGFRGQYIALKQVNRRYEEQGLVTIAIPSNDFNNTDKGPSAFDQRLACNMNFHTPFTVTEAAPVSGKNPHPLYRWIEQQSGSDAMPTGNFHKYIVSPEGELVAWFPANVSATSSLLIEALENHLPPHYDIPRNYDMIQ